MRMSERVCADVCGQRGRKGEVQIGWKRTGGHERAWMRGRVQTVWVQGKNENQSGEGPVGMSERGCADMSGQCGRKGKVEMVGGKDRWARGCMRRRARTVWAQ